MFMPVDKVMTHTCNQLMTSGGKSGINSYNFEFLTLHQLGTGLSQVTRNEHCHTGRCNLGIDINLHASRSHIHRVRVGGKLTKGSGFVSLCWFISFKKVNLRFYISSIQATCVSAPENWHFTGHLLNASDWVTVFLSVSQQG